MKRTACVVSALLFCAAAAGAGDNAVQRSRIERERQEIEAASGREEASCAISFAVNDCRADVRTRKREALRVLREQERVLDDRRRREKAAERSAQIERNRVAAEAEREAAPPRAHKPAPPASAAARQPPGKASAAARAEKVARAADRAAAAERRRVEAEIEQARIRERVARSEDKRRKKAAAAAAAVPAASR